MSIASDPECVIVTGAGSGIGRAVALQLAESGAQVCLVDRDAAAAQLVARTIRERGGMAWAFGADVGSAHSIKEAVDVAATCMGRVDGLVCSAGIQRYGDAASTTTAEWDEVIRVNLTGAFLTVRAALPHLRNAAPAAVVLVASVQGHATQERVVAYTTSKGGLHAMARAIAVDEARHGVRINTASPGSVDTPMLRASARLMGDDEDATVRAWGAAHPMGRVAKVEEVANAVTYLLSPRSSFITGEDIRVDGGLLSALPVALPDTKG